ncbi:MarR family winged helix-turn-helix transcriptional regulator [Paenalcaligenes hominis]|uniref:MarR family winged helix-turn-helix transcriptional regulator n=1 Tax=Paenalcaligenes hominis TaxID=643674 RepID=UPI0036215155
MLNEQSAPLGLTAMQWRPLVLIRYAGLDTAGELARRENTDTGAMTRTLDRLEAKGLLYRERCPIDRRVMKLKLSPTGENVCEAILPLVADSLNLHVAGFSDDEIQLCLRYYNVLLPMVRLPPKPQPDPRFNLFFQFLLSLT